jgi:DNA-directed RNA polymerase specialized sigma24 family protein
VNQHFFISLNTVENVCKTKGDVAGIIDESDTLTLAETDALAAEIKALKADDQLILNLYLNRVAEKDIAVRLNMNYSTVRQKVRRIKAELALKVQARLKTGVDNYACAA